MGYCPHGINDITTPDTHWKNSWVVIRQPFSNCS
jgi:hypothetical protein